jgi:hypothetical protein
LILHDLTQTLIAEKQNAIYALLTGNSVAILLFDLSLFGKIALGFVLSVVSGACIKGLELGFHEFKAYRLGNDSIFAKVKHDR